MNTFWILLNKLLPFYFIITGGFLAGKFLNIHRESFAKLLIYIITPVIVFNGILHISISMMTLSLPLVFYTITCSLCLIFYQVGKLIWTGSEKNILAFTAGNANTGYFGLPVAIALFGNNAAPFVILMSLGTLLYENTLGFFITARGNFNTKESLIRLAKLPNIYAFFLGLIINHLHLKFGQGYDLLAKDFQGCYSILGMMLIGLGLSGIEKFTFDYKFNLTAFAAKFLCWPLLILAIIFCDSHFWHFYSTYIHQIMLLISTVPLAANTVVYATALDVHPDKAAIAVFLSTIWVIIYMPLMITLVF